MLSAPRPEPTGHRALQLVVSAATAGSVLLAACGPGYALGRGQPFGLAGEEPGSAAYPPYEKRVDGGRPEEGERLIRAYGCGACHVVPGVPGANGLVGPPLIQWADRSLIAGTLPNVPENLVPWIMNPQAFEPGTAMPNLDVTEAEARDIAAYLYTLK